MKNLMLGSIANQLKRIDGASYYSSILEWFPTEYRKTKPKVITLANRNKFKHNESIRNTKQIHVTGAKRGCGQNTFGFCLDSHWLRKWREFCEPITERKNTKPKQT